ncbi:MAG: XRE family transcriptional regulator [Peptostreptococcaceae bacterium]|jgi:predicted transcriptional regulator|nr:XRE family transcriptional regulator [Peptostreptococcaceae bacterium]
MNQFEKDVRKALIDKEMNLSELANQLDISLSYLYDILKSSRKAKNQRIKIIQILNLNSKLANNKFQS